jgi:hypothetical protein
MLRLQHCYERVAEKIRDFGVGESPAHFIKVAGQLDAKLKALQIDQANWAAGATLGSAAT